MGGEFGHNPGVEPNPEHGKDLEIEVKIVNLGIPNLLISKLESLGAELEVEKRLLSDIRFNLEQASMPELNSNVYINVAEIENLNDLERVVEFLGYKINRKLNKNWIISRNLPPERRAVRIRHDSGKSTLTVKNSRVKNSTHDARIELNLQITNPKVAEHFLLDLGYKRKGVSEKYRTTYKLDDCLVEINYGPTAPPWGEIEGPNETAIFEVAQKLGYGKVDLASMSDGDYYKKFGVTKDQLRNMTFEKFKNKQNE